MNATQRSARERIVQEHIETELRHELDALVATFTADGEWRDLASAVVLEAIATGTHRGAWKGIPPTGKSVRFPLCAVFTFAEDDKIQAEIVYYDRLTVLAQLGVAS